MTQMELWKGKKSRLVVLMEERDFAELKDFARKNGESIATITRTAVKNYLKGQKNDRFR